MDNDEANENPGEGVTEKLEKVFKTPALDEANNELQMLNLKIDCLNNAKSMQMSDSSNSQLAKEVTNAEEKKRQIKCKTKRLKLCQKASLKCRNKRKEQLKKISLL